MKYKAISVRMMRYREITRAEWAIVAAIILAIVIEQV